MDEVSCWTKMERPMVYSLGLVKMTKGFWACTIKDVTGNFETPMCPGMF